MSNYTIRGNRLFDPVTGAYAGEIDLQGREQAFPTTLKNKQPTSGKLLAVGDSITAGQGPVSSTSRYSTLLAAANGWAETNVAVGGSTAGRFMEDQIGSRVIGAGDVSVLMAGFNDSRYRGSDAGFLSQFQSDLTACVAYLAVPDSSKKFTQLTSAALNSAQWTFSGTWPTSPNWGGASSRMGAYSGIQGDYAETTVTGDTIQVMLGGYTGFAGQVYFTVDGVRIGTAGAFAAAPLVAMADAGADAWRPVLFQLSGFSSGTHTVRVTINNSANTLVAYAAGFDSVSTALPQVALAGPIRMTTAGYAVSPASGTDASMRLYQDACRRVASSLASNGMLVSYVDLDSNWQPSASQLNVDNVHPIEMWHASAYRMFQRTITRSSVLVQ